MPIESDRDDGRNGGGMKVVETKMKHTGERGQVEENKKNKTHTRRKSMHNKTRPSERIRNGKNELQETGNARRKVM